MEPIEIFLILAGIFSLIYYWSTSNHNFWRNQGVPGPKPLPFFGNFKSTIFKQISIGDFLKKYYEQYENESMFGLYLNNTPIFILRDLELIKDILIKDFNRFADRGMPVHDKIEPLSQNLVALDAEKWRPLRKKLSPVFTSGKLKEMFHLLVEASEHLDNYLNKVINRNESIIECRLLTSKFTMNVIGSCAFGVDINALSDEKNEFVQMGQKLFATSFWKILRVNIKELTPWLFNALGPFIKKTEMAEFFTKFISDTMQYREEHNIVRHDFVDLLKHLKDNPDMDKFELTDSLIAAQAVTFFAAGFETSSTTMSNALYELAQNTKIQDQLRKEINQEARKSEGKFTYDGIKNMKYLHKVFQETLRKYPPGTRLRRRCLENYKISGTNVTIPKDVSVWIPIYAIHHDPKFYPKPDVFDPERFENDAFNSRHPMTFLPFGEGPRNCIGSRFAIFQTKIGLAKILQNYKVEICEKTPIPYVHNPKSELLTPATGLYLKFSKVHH